MASIIIHENYAAHKHDDDIAVVKLSSPVLFSENLRRVCLPDATFQVLPKSKVFVTGWGALRANGEYSRKTRMPAINLRCMEIANQMQSINQDNPTKNHSKKYENFSYKQCSYTLFNTIVNVVTYIDIL